MMRFLLLNFHIICLLNLYDAAFVSDMEIENVIEFEEIEPSNGSFSFGSYFGDHMVLQSRPRRAIIWGHASSEDMGQEVVVSISGVTETYKTMVMKDLLWSVHVGPMQEGGPHDISAKLGESTISITDVLFGDVWICSGQSNMEFSLSQVFNAAEELKNSTQYPDIRVFTVAHNTSTSPLDFLDKNGILLPWSLPSPASLGGGNFSHFSAVCWLYAKYIQPSLKKPLGMIQTTWGGTPVEAWSSTAALKKCDLQEEDSEWNNKEADGYTDDSPKDHSVLWNAMVHPLRNMTIYGAIWYQGEANAAKERNMNKYQCTFPAMIDDWRKQFHASSETDDLFPFGFVQLAGNAPDNLVDVGFPDIRWHQTANYGTVPNHRERMVFMAVAMDLPDFLSPYGSIHPRDKQDVAGRLALSGLAVAYGKDVPYQGPLILEANFTSPQEYVIEAKFFFSEKIQLRSFEGFEVCCSFVNPPVCSAGKSWWLPLPVNQFKGQDDATVGYTTSCGLDKIVGIRYAWRQTPCPFKMCSIYDAAIGLPAPPFIYLNQEFEKLWKTNETFTVTFE